MIRNVMQSTLRDLTAFACNHRLWIVFLVIVLVFTITGPFDTLQMPVIRRFSYWFLIQLTSWSIAILFSVVVEAALKEKLYSLVTRMIISTVVATFPIGLSIGIIDWGFTGKPRSIHGIAHNITIAAPLCLLFYVLTILTIRRDADASFIGVTRTPVTQSFAVPTYEIPLIQRLKPAHRGALLRLSAEDHYTLVVTSRGQECILLRFSDALKEIGETAGLRTHRSHWIANTNISKLRRIKGRIAVLTTDNVSIPVSRPYVQLIRQHLRHLPLHP